MISSVSLDNTLIVFMSDNGAAAEDFSNTGPFVEYLRERFTNTNERMSTSDFFVSDGPEWAEASAAPFSGHRAYTLNGGIVALLLLAGRGVSHERRIDSAYVNVMDLAPAILDAAGLAYPGDGSFRPPED